jgi:hypothetical protein
MSKSVKKRSSAAAGGAAKPSQQTTIDPKGKGANPGSKQSRVIAMALAAPSASRPERPVPRIRIGPALPDRKSLDAEIARLRDLGVSELRSRWHTTSRERLARPCVE